MITSFPTESEKLTLSGATVTVRGLGTSVPDFFSTQSDTLQFIQQHFDVREATQQLYKKTLGNKAIEKRHLALDGIEQVLDQNLDAKNGRFQQNAVELSTRALKKALKQAGIAAAELDFLVVTTCTGYLCPGLSSYVVESCGLKSTIHTADLAGMGCGAAIPAMEQAHNFLVAHPDSTAAVVCTEICTAAMVSTDDIDIVISNTIFSDGSAALILRSENKESTAAQPGALPRLRGFASRIVPEWRDTLRFKTQDGHLKNVLGKDVPAQAAQATRAVVRQLLADAGIEPSAVNHWILHAGGEKILNALEKSLELDARQLNASRWVLKNFGNMSSPTVLFVLEQQLTQRTPQKGEWGVVASFGAGFSAFGALIEWI